MERKWFFPKRENNKTLGDWEETLSFTISQIEKLEKDGSQDKSLFKHLEERREKAIAEIARLKGEGK